MQFTKKVPDYKKRWAISFLFPGQVLTSSEKEELMNYIDERFNLNHCVALHYSSRQKELPPKTRDPFPHLCDVLGLDPGMNEVVINEEHCVLYTNDYRYPPELVTFL